MAAALTEQGTTSLSGSLGSGIVWLDGVVVRGGEQDLVLSVRAARTFRGDESPWRGEVVTLPRTLVASVTERRFSFARSAMLGAAGVAAAIAIRSGFSGSIGGGGGGRRGGHPTPR